MEESKLSSNLDEGASMEARFSDLCKTTVSLDETMRMQATVLFRETKHILLANMAAIGTGSPEEIEKIWSAFVLYSVARLSQEITEVEERNRLTLSQVLRASELKFVDFFKEMPQFFLKTGHILSRIYGSDWEKRLGLEELQTSIDHLSHLSRYFTRAYRDFFLPTDTSSSQNSAVSRIAGYVSDYHQFGWLLFLSLRMHAFGRFKDLVTCTNGLVSIVAILIIHVPVRFRNFTIQNSPSFAKRSDKGINLLGSLCDIYHTSEDELRRTMGQVNSLIIDILKKKPCPVSECKSETLDHINPDGLTYFADLLEENSMEQSFLVLEKSYDDAISTRGELDERLFLSNDDNSLGSVTSSGCGIGISGSKRKFDTFASPSKTITNPISPLCSPTPYVNGNLSGNSRMPVATPVTTAMTTAKWLRDFISPFPPKPSSDLVCFLSSCDRDVTSDVTHRAIIILEAIFPSFGERCISRSWEIMSLVDSTWAEQRKMEALKLYYRVLEAVCRAESHILNGNNLTSLLSNERFHRCMIACSAELVLTTYKTITLTFPAVLEKTGITSFDLCKVIECFVRHEETLPRELKRHLNSLEERLLESMVWEKGSSIYNSLIVAKPTLSSDIKRLGLLAEPLPSLDSIVMCQSVYNGRLPPLPSKRCETSQDQNGDGRSPKRICGEYRSVLVERNSFRSPMKERLLYPNGLKSKILPLQSVFSSPARPNSAGGETCAEAGLNVFFNKVLKLAAIRIRSLCERLDLSQQILEHIYRLIQQILNQQTTLLFNRHIDQLILCSLYGVVKISQLSLTFKEIINSYKKQPQCKPQVFRSVFVDWSSTRHNGQKTGQEEHVDIITFYNEVFIPSVKPLLVELGPAGCTLKNNTCPEDNDNVDGQIPESPRLSSFPKLPDLTPKKVSPAHNVYVSPLQSSKMDSLLSPSSKSYYACVGESTHAYQSPSNDLTVINNRLKCGRRMINFDMVSDSVVAGTLCKQIGSSAASSAVKCEKPDF